jgi:hypothetical protein
MQYLLSKAEYDKLRSEGSSLEIEYLAEQLDLCFQVVQELFPYKEFYDAHCSKGVMEDGALLSVDDYNLSCKRSPNVPDDWDCSNCPLNSRTKECPLDPRCQNKCE